MHIQVTAGRGSATLLVDGVDITRAVARDGFEVDLSDPLLPMVRLTLMPDVLDLDIDGDVTTALLDLSSHPDREVT